MWTKHINIYTKVAWQVSGKKICVYDKHSDTHTGKTFLPITPSNTSSSLYVSQAFAKTVGWQVGAVDAPNSLQIQRDREEKKRERQRDWGRKTGGCQVMKQQMKLSRTENAEAVAHHIVWALGMLMDFEWNMMSVCVCLCFYLCFFLCICVCFHMLSY